MSKMSKNYKGKFNENIGHIVMQNIYLRFFNDVKVIFNRHQKMNSSISDALGCVGTLFMLDEIYFKERMGFSD